MSFEIKNCCTSGQAETGVCMSLCVCVCIVLIGDNGKVLFAEMYVNNKCMKDFFVMFVQHSEFNSG